MHDSTRLFVQRYVRRHQLAGGNVLEVGSLNVNGTVRGLFAGGSYLGVDIVDGPGVDRVVNAHQLVDELGPSDPGGGFDLVLCLEMLEHDDAPWLTMAQLGACVRPGGHLLVSARGNGFPEHNRPDRWRFMRDGFEQLLRATGLTVGRVTADPAVAGWFGVCTKAAG